MLLCNVGQEVQRFQGGVWNAAVVKFHFLCSPIHPTAWLWYKLTPLWGSVYETARLVFKSSFIIWQEVDYKQVRWKNTHMNAARPSFSLSVVFSRCPPPFFFFFLSLNSLECYWQAESHLSLDILCIRANVLQLGTGASAVAELSSGFSSYSCPEGSELPLRNKTNIS